MGTEIERRFLVREHLLQMPMTRVDRIKQAYISVEPAVRTRLVNEQLALLTIKGPGGLQHPEFEYEIPAADVADMDQLRIGSVIEKHRWHFGRFEVDEFMGSLRGRWIAEIELTSPDEDFEKPIWLGDEVTGDERYSNLSLALFGWPKDDDVTHDLVWQSRPVSPEKSLDPELLRLASTSATCHVEPIDSVFSDKMIVAIAGLGIVLGLVLGELVRLL